jgi:hypothetical protein
MSFFLPDRLTCCLCDHLIGSRREAAQLPYAHPDDVGELARHGRAWVHRRCWNESTLRDPWSASALRLLASDPAAVCCSGVTCRVHDEEVFLQDPWQAVAIRIPCDCIRQLLEASERGGAILLGPTRWTFELVGDLLEVTGADSGDEPFEAFRQVPGRWSPALLCILDTTSLRGS